MRQKYETNPKSLIGRFWRWHINFCPGWNQYFEALPEGEKDKLRTKYDWLTIKPYVDDFIRFAKEHPGLTFLVTRIGCGIAGFRDEQIAPLFADAINVENIILPMSCVKCLEH